MEQTEIQHFIEAALLAAGRPLGVDQIQSLFDGRSAPEKSEIRKAIEALNDEYEERGIEIREVASGFRMQVKASMSDRLQKLWEERPPRYSRALFETLALVAYRQPITRGEIEDIRGVAVSSNIVRTLMERDWVRVVGHRDVPGRPAMFGTTKGFLDYFNLKKLDDLPKLADLADWESLRVQLDLPDVDSTDGSAEEATVEAGEGAAVTNLFAARPDVASEDVAENAGSEEAESVAEAAAPAADMPEAEPELEESAKVDDEAAPLAEPAEAFGEADIVAEQEADPDSAMIPELVVEETGTELPELVLPAEETEASEGDEEQLIVSEWPDPAKSGRS